jgi:hypothetical protein
MDAEGFFKDILPHGVIPQYEVICDSSNNTKESIKRGELNVDLVFHGSLAQAVRDKLARYENATTSEVQCTGP